MLCIISNKTNLYFNLAAEEYLLKNAGSEACMLWQSTAAVIVGKHQNVLSEIDYRYAVQNNIAVARRLTGGGAVYHDPGNLNFSFIKKAEPGKLIDFQKHADPVIRFLTRKGISAYPGPKNEILVDGLKISGNAEHIFRNRIVHHGTLLFNADLTKLNEVISHKGSVYSDRAVRSNRRRVANLIEFLPAGMSLELFMHDLNKYILEYFTGESYVFDGNEEKAIQALADSKYASWDWIYGWSPDYDFRNNLKIGDFEAKIHFKTHRGIIIEFTLESKKIPLNRSVQLGKAFKHVPHRYENIQNILKAHGFNHIIKKNCWEDFVFGFF